MSETTKPTFGPSFGEAFASSFEAMAEQWQPHMEDAFQQFAAMTLMSKETADAFLASSRAAARGFGDLSKAAASASERAVTKTAETARRLADAKDPQTFAIRQQAAFKEQFDTMVAEASKATELGLKIASDVSEPLANRWSVMFQQTGRAA
ncbi:phasin family protein [Pedomonas mirosovicensis]|uniref:phasin family protein n=1 Tax=Pedomonas mirosovicensis TaxID=2908641 RepID=UPI002168594E|nr:phasin family protein [Pedomonas mirosovicensis]MCH8685951.1 phasin family protein [Pedomonas mirosovicensis]